MTQRKNDNILESLMQMVNENGLEAVTETFRILLNEAMKVERDQSLGAGLYERTDTILSRVKISPKNLLATIAL